MRQALYATACLLAATLAGGATRAEPRWAEVPVQSAQPGIDAGARAELTALIAEVETPPLQLAYRRAELSEPPASRKGPLDSQIVQAKAVAHAVPGDAAEVPLAASPAAAVKPGNPKRAALPLPPTPPFPRVGPPAPTVLPYTGLIVRPMPELPPLRAQGRLSALGADKPYAGFNAQTDCILDHQRFDSRGTRQRYPHACGPTRDLDFDLPAFTTR
jgi:hypothetical protein